MRWWRHIRDRIKRFRQRISRTRLAQSMISWLIAFYIRFVYYTSRKEFICDPSALPYANGEKNVIYAFWHGRLMMIPPFKPRNFPMHVLISRHNDGELIALTLKRFNISTIRGSSSKGGSKAAREVVSAFRDGGNISITPDGPRGPNRKAQAGIITLARLCKSPIVPLAYACSGHKALRSWDRMHLALPFGRLVLCIGAVLPAPTDNVPLEEQLLTIETALNEVTARADIAAGLSTEQAEFSATASIRTKRKL